MANRNNTFLLKVSNVSGKVPALANLTLGEVAVNTADAKMYSLFTGGATAATEVRQVGWDRLALTGGTLSGTVVGPAFSAASITATTLTISGVTNPLKIVGLSSGTTDTSMLTIDGTGVVHFKAISASSSSTTASTNSVSGIISGSAFSGNPKIAVVTFTNALADTSYPIIIAGEDSRTWTTESKTVFGFTINSNSNIQPVGTTSWIVTLGSVTGASFSSTANTVYNSNGTISGNRTIDISNLTFTFSSNTQQNLLTLNNSLVGIGTVAPSNKLTVSAATDPVKLTGVVSGTTDTNMVTIDGSGVLHFKAISASSNASAVSAVTLSAGNVLSVTPNGGVVTNTTINAATGGTYNAGTITLLGTGTVGTITGLPSTSSNSIYSANDTIISNRTVGLSSFTLSFSSNTQQNILMLSGSTIGMGTATPTNKLTISAATDPLRLIGLVSGGTDTRNVTVDATGVLHFQAISASSSASAISAVTLSAGNVLSVTPNGGSVTNTTINAATGGTYANGVISLLGTGTVGTISGLNSLSGTTLYAANGTLAGNRMVDLSTFTLSFSSVTNPNTLLLTGGSAMFGTSFIDQTAPEAVTISARSTTSYNLMTLDSNVNNYNQINITNHSSGISASTDIVATNDTGNESINYIDMGINSSTYANNIGTTNDAYLYSTGRELLLGNGSTGLTSNIKFFCNDPNANNIIMLISGFTSTVGIGTLLPTNKLTVSAATDPLRLIGLASGGTDTRNVTIDATGVLHFQSISAATNNPAGSNKSILFVANNVFSGDTGFTWDAAGQTIGLSGTNAGIIMNGITNEPAAPASGSSTLELYAKATAGKMVLKTIGSSGISTPLQSSWWQNSIYVWTTTSATAGLWIGTVGAGAGTFAATNPTSTNKYTGMKRSLYSTVVTTPNQQVGQRNTHLIYYRGSSAGMGGFFFQCRFGFSTWTNGDRLFVGFSVGSTAVVTVNPSTLVNMCGFGIDSGDTAMTFMHNDGAGTATKETIAGQPSLASNQGYDAYIFMPPNSSIIYYRLDNLNLGTTIIDSSTSTDIVVANTMMSAFAVMSNGPNAAVNAAQLGINRIYIETDL